MAISPRKKDSAHWLKAVNTLSTSFNLASRNIGDVLDMLLKQLIQELGAHAVAVWTVEERTRFMQIEVSAGLDPGYVRYFNKTDRIREGKALVGRVMTEQKTLYTLNPRTDQTFDVPRWRTIVVEEGFEAIVAAPMFVGKQVVGAFTIYYKKSPAAFHLAELQFLEIIANQVAVTIENIRNYDIIQHERAALKEQLEKLIDLQRVTGMLNLHFRESAEASLRFLADYLAKRFQGKGIAVFQRVEETLPMVASYGLSQEFTNYISVHPFTVGSETLVGRVAADGALLTSSRVMTDARIQKEWRTLMSIYGHVAMAALPLTAGGNPTGVFVIYYDRLHEFSEEETSVLSTFAQFISISFENLRAIQSLVVEKENTQAMLYSLRDGIIVYDLKNDVIELNPRAEELLSVRRDEVRNKNMALLGAEQRAGSVHLSRISSAPLADFETKEIALEDVGSVLMVTHLPFFNESKQKIGSIRVLHDVSAERAVEKLKASFLSTASHQMRTPLTGIRWSLHVLLGEGETAFSDDQRDVLSRALQTTENMVKLIDDLLDVSRIEEGRFGYQFSMTQLEPLVERIVSEVQPLVEQARISFTMEPPTSPLPRLSVDADKIVLAIQNVIDNAIKYTPPGGKTVIRYSVGTAMMILSVVDTGIGIPKEDQKFLFNKFFRARNAVQFRTEGSGLGLYIARNIVEKHNGKITVDSVEGVGSSFFIQFPLDPAKMPQGTIKGL